VERRIEKVVERLVRLSVCVDRRAHGVNQNRRIGGHGFDSSEQ
jgi:hypothetical protein